MTGVITLQDKLESEIDFNTSQWNITQSPKDHDNEGPLILKNNSSKITVVDGPFSDDGVLTIEKLTGNNSESLKVSTPQEGVDIIANVYMS